MLCSLLQVRFFIFVWVQLLQKVAMAAACSTLLTTCTAHEHQQHAGVHPAVHGSAWDVITWPASAAACCLAGQLLQRLLLGWVSWAVCACMICCADCRRPCMECFKGGGLAKQLWAERCMVSCCCHVRPVRALSGINFSWLYRSL